MSYPYNAGGLEMRHFTVIKWKKANGETKKFRLKSQIFHKWEEIGNLLAIPSTQLKRWSKDKNPRECCDAVLQYWLDNPPDDYPFTWEGLYELLDDCELDTNIIEELKDAVEKSYNVDKD